MKLNHIKEQLIKIQNLYDNLDKSNQNNVYTKQIELKLLEQYINDLLIQVRNLDITVINQSVQLLPTEPKANVVEKAATPPTEIKAEPIPSKATHIPISTPLAASPTPSPKSTGTPKSKPPSISTEVEDLFIRKKANNISDRIQNTAIKNLTTEHFNIQEKRRFAKNLFGQDNDLFNKTILTLNKFDNIDQAKNYLNTELINKFSWASDKKKEIAKAFITIVRRRYL